MYRFILPLAICALYYGMQACIPVVNANSNVDEILSNLEQATNSITTLRANLHQETRNNRIGGRIVQNGKLYIDRVNKYFTGEVIIKYTNGSTVRIEGDKVTIYRTKLTPIGGTSRLSEDSKDALLTFMACQYNLTANRMKEHYTIIFLKDEKLGNVSTAVLEFSLKDKSNIQTLKLWIDRKSWLPVRLESTDNDGDQKIIELSRIKLGSDIKNEILTYPLKKNQK